MIPHSLQSDFERDGFVGPLDILSADEAREALAAVENELSKDSNRFKLHLLIPKLSQIAHHPILVAAVQKALKSKDILLWSSDINQKPPSSAGFFAPHQDATYAGLAPSSKCLTAWIAFSSPVGELEGCLSFYPK